MTDRKPTRQDCLSDYGGWAVRAKLLLDSVSDAIDGKGEAEDAGHALVLLSAAQVCTGLAHAAATAALAAGD